MLELSKWNISNNGADAVNTSIGINKALEWAFSQNYNEVVFPKGTYLIDENNPILPKSFMTLNLGGALLKIRDNNMTSYSVILFNDNQKYSRITNGIIQGDRDTHDYSPIGTHEGGYGIQIGQFAPTLNGGNNVENVTIDNMEIFNLTGDAISINSTFGQIFPTPNNLSSSWELGGISPTDGSLINDNSKIRSSLKVPMNQPLIMKYQYFGLYGNGFGSVGEGILTDFYDLVFYNLNDEFISSKTQIQFFDEVKVPDGANYARVVLHQSQIPDKDKSSINIRVPTFPQYIFIEKCNLHKCRRQGISLCGAKNIFISDNRIHHIAGTSPQSGIDIEDGYDLNQDIFIKRNKFHDNGVYNVIIVNGKSITLSENHFSKTTINGPSLSVNGGTDKVFVEKNTFQNTKIILIGNLIFSGNYIYGTQVSILGKYKNRPINITDSTFHNCKIIIDNPFAYLVKIDNCQFFNDTEKLAVFKNLQWTLELKNEPQSISNCTFSGQDLLYLTYSTKNNFKSGWVFDNNLFYDVKNPSLFSGTYRNCIFQNFGFLSIFSRDTDQLLIENCKFLSTEKVYSPLIIKNIQDFIFENCMIEISNGNFLKIQSASTVSIRNNTFKIITPTSTKTVISIDSPFLGVSFIENNIISAEKLNQVGIQNSSTNNMLTIIRNNTLLNASVDYGVNSINQNNIINGNME